jgi:hypothetical protein
MQENTRAVRGNRGWRITLCLLTGIAVLTVGAASAQTLLGTPGAGWQTWNTALDINGDFVDLNSNGAPYWDVPFLTFNAGGYGGQPANKSVGWCMTSNGDCVGIGSALNAPGALPFWAMPYNSASDTGGAQDTLMCFRGTTTTRSMPTFTATLYLNTATNTQEINEFGWFETNATGSLNGTKHVIFQGSGYPPGTLVPDPVGKVVNFTPTQYFGFYYSDVSDTEFDNGPPHGCFASTIFAFNDEDCTAAGDINGAGQGDHVFAIFLQSGATPVYWIAGQDPNMCNNDGDCNLTVVRIRRVTRD